MRARRQPGLSPAPRGAWPVLALLVFSAPTRPSQLHQVRPYSYEYKKDEVMIIREERVDVGKLEFLKFWCPIYPCCCNFPVVFVYVH
ncbi:hypothetical protein D5086_029249 [Populus alba]|uniref:Uncharacterized protein n=1 Tax=Populus alba TaxID=43335 RepID=A0ACC4ATN0_POPAL